MKILIEIDLTVNQEKELKKRSAVMDLSIDSYLNDKLYSWIGLAIGSNPDLTISVVEELNRRSAEFKRLQAGLNILRDWAIAGQRLIGVKIGHQRVVVTFRSQSDRPINGPTPNGSIGKSLSNIGWEYGYNGTEGGWSLPIFFRNQHIFY